MHIHDGRVHAQADFDHDLYCQLPAEHPLSASEDDGLMLMESHGWLEGFG